MNEDLKQAEPAASPPRAPSSLVAAIFFSRTERRLRAGWRLVLQIVLQLVLTGCAAILLTSIWHGPIGSTLPGPLVALAELGEFIGVTASIFIARRVLDRRSFVSLGVRPGSQALRDIAAGMGITFVMMGSIFAFEMALGWLEVRQLGWKADSLETLVAGIGLFLGICTVVGWNEELMSRGYHLQTLANGLGLGAGWVLSSLVFGALHFANPHSSWAAVLGIVFAGLFLGYGLIRTGQLWLPIGLHIGWNFFEGVVFGFPVSGISFYRLVRTDVRGPFVWTGGEFGPEAGLILLPALVIGALLIWIYTRGRQRL